MLLNAINYDPATLVTHATSSALVMTPFDTTNLRVTFAAPPTGRVLVRIRVPLAGSTYAPGVLLGLMDTTGIVVMRSLATTVGYTGNASVPYPMEVQFVISGLTAAQSYTWDAAYGVEFPVGSTSLRYGGPNDATANNAYGAFLFEVWEA